MAENKKADFIHVIKEAAKKPYEERKAAERQLSNQVFENLDSIKTLLKNCDVPVRRSIVGILSHATPSQQIFDLLLEILFEDNDIKARRRAAAALGEIGNKDIQHHLVRAFEQEEHRFVKASIILALGSLGFEWSQEWNERIGHQGPIAEAFRKASARSEAKGKASIQATEELSTIVHPAAVYMLECYPGVEDFVLRELSLRGFKEAQIKAAGWLEIDLSDKSAEELKSLGRIRTILSTYIAASSGFKGSSLFDDYIINACKKIEMVEMNETSKVRFRLSLPKMETRSQYRKAVVRIARRITSECGFKNNPSDYQLDIRVENINNVAYVLWRDLKWRQPKGRKGRLFLPASIHPTVAASLCIAGEINEKDVFCDPCCGAGTILSERLGLAPAKKILGFDISSEAIRMSRQNLSKFGDKVDLKRADMRSLPINDNSLDIIVTNLPFGIRVGNRNNNRALYRDFIKETLRVLTTKGRVVVYTHDAAAFERGCFELGWNKVKRLASVQAGGLKIFIYKGSKS